MHLSEKLVSTNLRLERLAKTFKQAHELFALTDRNRTHLLPFLDWVLRTNRAEDSYDTITYFHKAWEEKTAFEYGIFDAGPGRLIGIAGAYCFSQEHKKAELGFWLDRDFTGRGLAREAVTALENELIRCGIKRIVIKNDTQNIRSAALAKAMGYEFEGISRKDQFLYSFNELRDFNVFAKTAF